MADMYLIMSSEVLITDFRAKPGVLIYKIMISNTIIT